MLVKYNREGNPKKQAQNQQIYTKTRQKFHFAVS